MKVNQLIEKLLDKWVIKLLCLAAAIFLYIFHQVSLVETKTFTVPLRVQEEGNSIHTNDIQKYISVIIKANREEISTIHVDDIKAYLNLNYQIEKGTFNFPVNIELTEKILGVDPLEIKVKPETISVTCEPKITKFIPVEASIVGEPAYGYEIDEFSIEPGIIQITGPESIVERTNKIQTNKIDITGTNKKIETNVSYINLNPVLSYNRKQNFNVEINVKPIIKEVLFSDIPVVVKNLSSDLVLDTNLPKISFSVKGTMAYLDNYKISSEAVQIDLSKIKDEGKYDIPVKIILPQALTLVSKSDEKINIEVSKIAQLFEDTNTSETIEEQNQ